MNLCDEVRMTCVYLDGARRVGGIEMVVDEGSILAAERHHADGLVYRRRLHPTVELLVIGGGARVLKQASGSQHRASGEFVRHRQANSTWGWSTSLTSLVHGVGAAAARCYAHLAEHPEVQIHLQRPHIRFYSIFLRFTNPPVSRARRQFPEVLLGDGSWGREASERPTAHAPSPAAAGAYTCA